MIRVQSEDFDIGAEILSQNNLSNNNSKLSSYDIDWLEKKQSIVYMFNCFIFFNFNFPWL